MPQSPIGGSAQKKSGDIPSTQTGGTGTYKMYGPKV